MKGHIYRLANQTKIHATIDPYEQLTQIFDNKLHYLNHSFEQNMKIQEFYLDLIKNKRNIHSKQLKYYYQIFTNSKAESVMFQHQIHHQNQNLELNQNNKQMVFALKRLYCRLIEKIMVKISYYLMNKSSFNFGYTHASQLIKKCETLMRRLNHIKDFSNFNEVIQRVFQQNEEFQQYIFDQLINKGYINSVDQFYRINGIDLEHRDVYERNKNSEDDQQSQQKVTVEKKIQFKAKYQSNLNKDIIKKPLKKEFKPVSELKNPISNPNRTGILELQARYKDLIITLDNIITQEKFQQIAEVKQAEQQYQKDQIDEPLEPVHQQTNIQSVQVEPQNEPSVTTQEGIQEEQIKITHKIPNLRHLSQSRTTKMKRYITKKTSQIMSQQYQTRSELHQKQITIPSLNSSSMIPDKFPEKSRKSSRNYTSPFFSKSFVNAIKSIQKSNLIDQPNRLSIKRMSEHIIQFHRQSQKQSLSLSPKNSKQKMNIMQVLKKSNQKKSIIKLLNIYKNRTLENYIVEARKELLQTSQNVVQIRKQTRPDKRSQSSDKHSRYQVEENLIQNNHYLEPLSKLNDGLFSKRKILRNQTKLSIFKRQSTQKFKHLQNLKTKLKQNIEEEPNRTENMLKRFQQIQSKLKNSTKSSIFQNFRLSQKVIASNNFKATQRQNSSLRNSPDKQALQSTSILTSNGIQSIDISKYNQQRKIERLNKTLEISPIQTPLFPHFEVYDRVRRIVIK